MCSKNINQLDRENNIFRPYKLLLFLFNIIICLNYSIPCFSATLQKIEQQLTSIQQKFNYNPEKINHWLKLYREVSSLADLETLEKAINNCTDEDPQLIEPCLDFIANFNYSVLKNLKIANEKKIAFSLPQEGYSFTSLVTQYQQLMSKEDVELLTLYLRKAQDKGWIEELNEPGDLIHSIYLGVMAPHRLLNSLPDLQNKLKWRLFAFIINPEYPEIFGGLSAKYISNWAELVEGYSNLITENQLEFLKFIFNLSGFEQIEFQPKDGPIAFKTLDNNIDILMTHTAYHPLGKEAYIEYFKTSFEFSKHFRSAGHHYVIEILPVLHLFKSLGYTDSDLYELARNLDQSTYQKLTKRFSSPLESETQARAEFSHFLKELRSDSKTSHQDIPITKMAQFLANSSHGMGSFNDFLAQIKQTPLPVLQEVLRRAPYLVIDHFAEKATQESPNLLKENPKQWAQNLLNWMGSNPESMNPHLNVLFFEATEGRWESLQSRLNDTSVLGQMSSKKRKIKDWFMESLSGNGGTEIRQFLIQLEKSKVPSDFEIFSEIIERFSSPLLQTFLVSSELQSFEGSKLTKFLGQLKEFLEYAQFLGILERKNWTQKTLLEAKEDFHVQQLMSRVDISLLKSEEEKENLSNIIKMKIISKPTLVESYEDFLNRMPGLINPKWFLLSERYQYYFVPTLLKHSGADPEVTMQKIRAHIDEINILTNTLGRFISLGGESITHEFINVLAEDKSLIESLNDQIYEKTPPFPKQKKLYRWGEKAFEKARISGEPFTLNEGNRLIPAFGAGLYLAEDPLSSARFGVQADDPYLVEVTLPEDTHLLDLSTPEARSAIWQELQNHPLIRKAGVSEKNFDKVVSFLNPKSVVIRTDKKINNGYYVYKTSKIGSKETVSKPKLSLNQLKSATPDVGFSKPGQETAVAAHIFKRLLTSDLDLLCSKSPKTSLKFDFGLLYHVLEDTGTPFAIESRDSIRKRKAFRCQMKENKAVIATTREIGNEDDPSELNYETSASSCEQLGETWKNGFLCEPTEKGFRWVDLHAAFQSTKQVGNFSLFHSELECKEAGNRRNLFWNCLPHSSDSTSSSTSSSTFSIQPEYLYSHVKWFGDTDGSPLHHGQFGSFQSCMRSLDKMSFGLICLPQAQKFELSSLFHYDYDRQTFATFEACQSTLETQIHSALNSQLQRDFADLIPSELLKTLSNIPVIQKLMAEPNTEGGNLGFHSVEVLKHWDQRLQNLDGALQSSLSVIARNLEVTQERLNSLLRTAILVHDLGKPLSHRLQHLTTAELAKSIFEKMEFNHREVQLGLSLIDQDLIGDFLKHKRTKGSQRALKAQIKSLARILGLDPNAWYRIMLEFYTADAAFYPALRDSLFSSRPNGLLEINEPLLKELIGKLQ